MKHVLIAAAAMIVIVAGVFWLARETAPEDVQGPAGEVVISVTDAAADMQAINEVRLEVEEVALYSQAQGWVTLSSDAREYALLALNAEGRSALFAKGEVAADTYDRMRVVLGDVAVESASEGEAKAVLPSGVLEFDVDVLVRERETAHVNLDFIAHESLHTAADGTFVFAPVLAVKSESAAVVSVEDNDTVVASGGNTVAEVRVGLDLSGETKADFALDSSAGLEVETQAIGPATFRLGGKTILQGSTSTTSADGAEGDADMQRDAGATVDTGVSTGATVDVGEGDAQGETNAGIQLNL